MSRKGRNYTMISMGKAFLMGNGVTPPTNKSAALNTKYKDWWYFPGHRQHTGVIDIYEEGKD